MAENSTAEVKEAERAHDLSPGANFLAAYNSGLFSVTSNGRYVIEPQRLKPYCAQERAT